jgi:hypothetical protein
VTILQLGDSAWRANLWWSRVWRGRVWHLVERNDGIHPLCGAAALHYWTSFRRAESAEDPPPGWPICQGCQTKIAAALEALNS